jgi:hydroxymethylpyrimidine pyrophosphatase-like HAD family hydrolase
MEKHIIIIDLDGTLMLDFSHYEEETIAYLKKLHNEGHIILIATGRPLRSSFFVHQAIGLDTPIINYNGALISNPYDDNFPKTDLRVSKDDLAKIFDFAGDNLINVFGEIHDDIYVLDYNEEIHDFLHVEGGVLHEGPMQETLPDNPNGCFKFSFQSICNCSPGLDSYLTCASCEHFFDFISFFQRYTLKLL